MFSTHPKTNFNFSVAFNLSSANAFSLEQSKIFSFGRVNYLQVNTIIDFTNLKEFDTFYIMISVFDKVENIVGNGENAVCQVEHMV